MARPPNWAATLQAARDEALLAVRLYNNTAEARAFEGFVVHMHVAWLYLLHTRFLRDSVDFRYRERDNPRRFVKVDGEYKRWELARCVEERWPDPNDPVRTNLEFFIGLRNRIEHRPPGQEPRLGRKRACSSTASQLRRGADDHAETVFADQDRQLFAPRLRERSVHHELGG